ncbi:hypothetical protein [Microbacterium trichothecenolyticum]|uniref:Uncharacterized protein n=1 Tax=Microbacterium trichothecenolyticum TaxID=69370 RepID=A0A0M2HFY9_MICTR|nr:hypothetical protein [Microbacterium trichothecenolyticum]KJL45561.1 hypothetical protein RS82_00113 [Microbacterium trichothecenolyticum]
MSKTDRDAWETYVRGEIARFYDHCDGITYIWQNTPTADKRVAQLGGDSELAAFSGPWHVIAKHLTTEFRQWVEEYEATERLTFSEWRAAQIAARAEVAFTESADYTLGQLEELRRLTLERDALVVEASKRGASKVAIARAVGLSRQQIHTIVGAAELAPVTPIRPDVEEVQGELRQLASGEWVEVF